ncbi:penicillin-binding protein 2 [Nostoc sp. NIES-4103]|nr:penicillin-binding protein 2 [Nostoc sp. NIES-4103]
MSLFPSSLPSSKKRYMNSQAWFPANIFNRALSASPPASTFKIITTTAGLESGGFSPDTVPLLPLLPLSESCCISEGRSSIK